ncbi:uncharacterized protein M421DRAFT_425164 [Didymella exigua CBS 183.55]|uniref:DUF7053 domain-containing protein n=1 Tax=Didymella exigua CBS 183.55 TaxID=1150837 RepID=A0A6A5RE65_9PLEO|nr:uncharacterized protein M421DRAFT_425164 [Didymella exigua CBS 183.55]KAF1923997.1 hypothetical protein M421DRAFT_425164 [Didymella exigua CBS 183.55]
MFSLTSTATLHHVTHLPPSTTLAQALSCLHNHDLLIRLDPELAHYDTLPSSPTAPDTKRYKVTDNMHTLPKGLWDTTVTFEADITNTDNGIEWIIRAPLGLLQRTTWRVVKRADLNGEIGNVVGDEVGEWTDGEGEGEWSLIEDVEIKASRLLTGTVRGKCEENWRGVHGRFVGHLGRVEVKS